MKYVKLNITIRQGKMLEAIKKQRGYKKSTTVFYESLGELYENIIPVKERREIDANLQYEEEINKLKTA